MVLGWFWVELAVRSVSIDSVLVFASVGFALLSSVLPVGLGGGGFVNGEMFALFWRGFLVVGSGFGAGVEGIEVSF